MTLAELQRALTTVEPAAVLVPPRVMENVIRQVLQLSGMVWSVPHRDSWIVDRTILFRHVEQADLVLAPEQILPASVILLSWPTEDDLQRHSKAGILLRTWRQLFHASIHQAMTRCWDEGRLNPARLRQHIEAVGPTAIEEIQTVLKQENILLAEASERDVFNEFAAVFLELFYFSPTMLPSYFPGLRDTDSVKKLLDEDLASDVILRRTRLPNAPDPKLPTETRTSEANEFFHELEVSSEGALTRGNMVQAAIELQRAARVAPADLAPATRLRAESVLNQLLVRFCQALEIPDDERAGWNRLLPILLEKADQGSRPAEASLLNEIQKICLDHEREIYKLEVVEWLLSGGHRPLKRPLPSQRLVRITRTLRAAMPSLTSARLSDKDRGDLESLLQKALHRSEERVRLRFRPLLTNALQDVGLVPHNPLETTAFRKMVEELLDKIITYGFVTFSDLRDTISRNQLKMGDLSDAQDFIRGDPLLRLDRRLAAVLDGVYRPGEFYLRWLERFTALNFGTKVGRALTRFVTLPVGGGFMLLETVLLLIHMWAKRHVFHAWINRHVYVAAIPGELLPDPLLPPILEAPPERSTPYGFLEYSLWVFFTLVIFGLLHSAPMRDKFYRASRSVGRGLRRIFVDWPVWAIGHESLKKILDSGTFQLCYWYLFKPAMLTLLLAYFVPQLRIGWFEVLLAFLAANFLINSRPGEIVWDALLKTVQNVFLLLQSGLIPGVFRFIVRAYKQILHAMEGVIFTVDEWLRIRGGETKNEMILRAIVTLFWAPISYLARFNLVVFIEPALHPLKLPICSIAAKFVYPITWVYLKPLTDFGAPFLGPILSYFIVRWIYFWLPDVFAFIIWEMKENWALYRANRRQTIGAVSVGPHAETVRRLFQPGFHSGTLPKLFAKIRHAETKALSSGNYTSVRLYRSIQQEIEEAIARFMTREFCVLLEQSPSWRDQPLAVRKVELSSNQIIVRLHHPAHADQPLILTFENRSQWLVTCCDSVPWLAKLEPAAQASLRNALVLLYKLTDANLIREQVRSLLMSPQDQVDFTPQGLAIWPADRPGKMLHVDLRLRNDPDERIEIDPGVSILAWDPQRVLFSQQWLTRDECLASWPQSLDAHLAPPLLLADIPILPAAKAADERESAA